MRTIAFAISILLFYSISVFCQEHEHPRIVASDSTWGSEFFEFPIRFAREINYEGLEEAVFPSGWGDEKSDFFWTYAFAWDISSDKALLETDFEINLQHYFDGLLGLSFERKNEPTPLPKTNAIFISKAVSNGKTKYLGKIKTFDTRFTQKPMLLNVQAEQHYCEKTKKSVILFKFSPKGFSDDVWLKLDEVTLPTHSCEK